MIAVTTATATMAQDPATEELVEGQPNEQIIDEVTVLGVRELADLRVEVIRAEDVVYDLYNELNDDDGYDIICKKETRIGSQIPKRVCQARLFRNAVAEAARDVAEGELMGGVKMNEAKHNAILREKMAALATKHPELLAALRKRLEVSKKFEQEWSKKFD